MRLAPHLRSNALWAAPFGDTHAPKILSYQRSNEQSGSPRPRASAAVFVTKILKAGSHVARKRTSPMSLNLARNAHKIDIGEA